MNNPFKNPYRLARMQRIWDDEQNNTCRVVTATQCPKPSPYDGDVVVDNRPICWQYSKSGQCEWCGPRLRSTSFMYHGKLHLGLNARDYTKWLQEYDKGRQNNLYVVDKRPRGQD